MLVIDAQKQLDNALSVYFKLTHEYDAKTKALQAWRAAAIDKAACAVNSAHQELLNAKAKQS